MGVGARRLGALAVTSALALSLLRCGTLVSSPDAPPGDGGGGEGGGGDGGSVDAGGDVAGASSILPNGTFDTGCQFWGNYQADLTPEPDGRNGQGCRVCVKSGANLSYGFSIVTDNFPSKLGAWNAEIYVHAVSGVPSAGYRVQPVLRTFDDAANPVNHKEYQEAQLQTIGPVWVPISVALTVTQPASYIDFYVYMPNPVADACFAVDDAKLIPPP